MEPTANERLAKEVTKGVVELIEALTKVMPPDEAAMIAMVLPEYLPRIEESVKEHPVITRMVLRRIKGRIEDALAIE